MNILALEFSASERSVAVATREADHELKVLAVAKDTSREVTGLALIDRAMRQAKLNPAQITDITVGLGPGSYTGIRSAIALAQGWQLGGQIRVTGIGSIQCLAHQAQELGMRGDHSLIVDAQRGDVYHQVFRLGGQAAEKMTELRIIPMDEVRNLSNVIGPEAKKYSSNAAELSPSADFLVRLHVSSAAVPAEQLQPIYLREVAFVKAPTPRQIA